MAGGENEGVEGQIYLKPPSVFSGSERCHLRHAGLDPASRLFQDSSLCIRGVVTSIKRQPNRQPVSDFILSAGFSFHGRSDFFEGKGFSDILADTQSLQLLW
jgi:hypothetical protein